MTVGSPGGKKISETVIEIYNLTSNPGTITN